MTSRRGNVHRVVATGLVGGALAFIGYWLYRRVQLSVGAAQQKKLCRVTVIGDANSIDALQRFFELDRQMLALADQFDFTFTISPQPCPPAEGPGITITVDGQLFASLPIDFARRRRASLPPFVVRWLRYMKGKAAQLPSGESGSLPQSHAVTPAMEGTGAASAPPKEAPLPQPSLPVPRPVPSGECLESGAVAGAMPVARRRRTVEERVMKVAIDLLAPLTVRERQRAPSSGRQRQLPLTETNLPYDTFVADAACAHLHEFDRSLPDSGSASSSIYQPPDRSSDYVTALVYLMDVQAARGERLIGCRLVAEETAERIVQQHRNDFNAITHDLELVLGSEMRVESQAQIVDVLISNSVTIASHAVNSAQRAGPFAAGPEHASLASLLDAGSDTVTLLAFPRCNLGALYLMREVYDSMVAHFGRWTMEAFISMMTVVWERSSSGRPHSSGWSRLFRSMNRSRTGEVSFNEFVGHFAKKVSACEDEMDPDLALVLCLARQRFLHLLFYAKRAEWPGRSFWFDAIVDVHDTSENAPRT
jgi:hypothetical protein